MPYLVDSFGREINYLRVSLTDKCNLRCLYCMPQEGISHKEKAELLSLEEILRVIKIACSLGISKVRLTGGEPLLRKNIFFLIGQILAMPEVKDFSLTTNGVLLKNYVCKLKEAGVKRLNISLDTLDADKFRYITKQDCFFEVLSGIEAAKDAGLALKLNMVVMKGINDDEILDFARFCEEKKITLRFIEFMPLGRNSFSPNPEFVPSRRIRDILKKNFAKITPCDSRPSNTAVYYQIDGFSQVIGFISPMSEKFCFNCSRLRLSSMGLILPCLGDNFSVDIRAALRKGAADGEIAGLIQNAVNFKPEEHGLTGVGKFFGYAMSQVGG